MDRTIRNRRTVLTLLSAPFLAGCAGGVAGSGGSTVASKVALLLPLTGARAGVGNGMQRAAQLAFSANPDALNLEIIDTGGDPATAARVATAAVAGGAKLVLGPLTSAEVPAVLSGVAGRAPVVTFSNDPALIGSGAFVFGVTPAQSVAAVFAYARDNGLQRVAVVVPPGAFGQRALEAARVIAPQAGLTLTSTLTRTPGSGALTALLTAEAGGEMPDAVLLPDGGASLDGFANELAGSGAQLLGTAQWSQRPLAGIEALQSAVFPAPDPAAFTRFAEVYRDRNGTVPGILAGLAFDAVGMAQNLSAAGNLTAIGLTRSAGFKGVVGDFRLRADGVCLRDLAILSVEPGGERVLAPAAG